MIDQVSYSINADGHILTRVVFNDHILLFLIRETLTVLLFHFIYFVISFRFQFWKFLGRLRAASFALSIVRDAKENRGILETVVLTWYDVIMPCYWPQCNYSWKYNGPPGFIVTSSFLLSLATFIAFSFQCRRCQTFKGLSLWSIVFPDSRIIPSPEACFNLNFLVLLMCYKAGRDQILFSFLVTKCWRSSLLLCIP